MLRGKKKVGLRIFVILEMKGWRRWRKEWYDPAKCRNNFSPLAPLRKAPFFCVFPTWTNHQLMNCKRKGTRAENWSRIISYGLILFPRVHRAIQTSSNLPNSNETFWLAKKVSNFVSSKVERTISCQSLAVYL